MNANVKKLMSILLILFAVGTMVVFAAPSEAEYNSAYKSGYLDGYSENTKKLASHNKGYHGTDQRASSRYPGNSRQNPDLQTLRSAYKSGYAQGWDDKAAGKDNRYF